MRSLALLALVVASAQFAFAADAPRRERIDRGVIARPTADGKVYVSWRLMADDPADVSFDVYENSKTHGWRKLNTEPIRQTTDYVATPAGDSGTKHYCVRPRGGAKNVPIFERAVSNDEKPLPYVSIKLDGDHTLQKVGIADLDGDGRYDFVIKQPNNNIDPYEKYWKPSPSTYKLEAYSAEGKFLWRYDLGWAIEQGIWYSPYVVYDFDGDGKAEVAVKTGEGDPRDSDGRVKTGPEHLTILDGATGKPLTQIAWPARELIPDYNRSSRNQLGVAYLDGKTPSLIVNRGTYDYITFVAYQLRDGKLVEQWRWENKDLGKEYKGQGAHWMHAADVDGDGREEIVAGSFVLDDNGKPLWTTGLGHPDHTYVGDIDPTRPGLEIYFGIERAQKKNGMCLVDAATGKILWGIDRPTRHVHSFGFCSDIDPAHPGSECYSADTDPQKDFAFGLLHSAQGKLLAEESLSKFGPRAAYWDADAQREIIAGSKIDKYQGAALGKLEGAYVATVDLWGDWREEIITTRPGEMRIYTTTIPAKDRRVCLMQDPIYRMDVVMAAMGYYQVPMLSYDLATKKP